MKRFRSRKSSPERGQGSPRRSLDTDPPSLPIPSWRWRKPKAAPEPKPEFNISAALPASEAFRTSLLMPNLSARFSMLREQDDPLSKIGKANDDSVLFPKRASRLDLFKGHGLSEISEADYLRGFIRPPFTSTRTESYGSAGYDTDDGSVMSRARPGEGNTMFGGRQKIYKIPVGGSGSVKKFGAKDDDELPSGVNMGGKALYESDIATSTFQRLREEERQERERASVEQLRSSKEQDRDGSPPLAKYNRNRETSSSTNSGLSQPRMSTAATSVASQRSVYYENMGSFSHALSSTGQPSSAGSDRPFHKTPRRLYKQDLEQHMHEQQSSAIHRLESLNKQRSIAGSPASRNLQQPRSATGLNDRYQPGGPLYASAGFRAGSPPPSGTPARMDEFDLGLGPEQAGNNLVDSGYGRSPPLSPPMSPGHDPSNHDPTFLAALEPNDLGKATASGAFNKPKLQFDEQQYKERQIQLLEGRNTPSPQPVRPFSPQGLSIDSQTNGRSRENSLGSTFSRTESFRQPWDHHREDRVLRAVPERGSRGSLHTSNQHQTNTAMEQSFLNGRSSSDVAESEPEAEPNLSIPSFTPKYPTFSHPKPHAKPGEFNQKLIPDLELDHLTPPAEEKVFDNRSHLSESTITQPKDTNDANTVHADSPTLGPVGITNGLSGLVQAHLRNDSGQSSIYPEDYAATNRSPVEVRQSIFGHESALNHSRQGSKDDSGVNGEYWVKGRRGSEQSSIVAPPPLSFAARHILQQASEIRDNAQNPSAQQMLANEKAQQILGGEAPRSSHSRNNSNNWQDQLKAHHARCGSTETQQEREGLAKEMAERRRRVQDSLKTYVEDDSKSPSPAPFVRPQDDSLANTRHPFGILKKTSRGSLVGKQERPTKAMKMLGIRQGEAGSDASQSMPDMFTGRGQLHDRTPQLNKKPSPPRSPHDLRQYPGNGPTFRQRLPISGRSPESLAQRVSSPSSKSGSSYGDHAEKRLGSGKDSVPLPSVEWNRVNGSNPVTAATGYEPRDLQNAPRSVDDMVDNMTRNGLPSAGRSQSAMSQRPPMSPTERSQSAMGGRIRSNSKPVSPSYFEPRTAPPGTPYMINPKQFNRAPPPGTPFMINPKTPSRPPIPHSNRHRAESTATSNESRPSSSSMTTSPSTMIPPQMSPSYAYTRPEHPRKRSINKQDISEPTFISSTSSVDTVNLPPGASLSNGMEAISPTRGPPPPIPVRNSRRKRTHTFLQALARTEKPAETISTESMRNDTREEDPYEERSTFSADDEPSTSSKLRQRLRKTSSEGGLNAKAARQAALQAPSPAVPHFEVQSPGLEQHFPYQAQKDVPASAVMF